MGFYDNAYKNIGNQVGYAAGAIGGYIMHQFSKEKSEQANQSVQNENEARRNQKADLTKRFDRLQSAYDEQQKLLISTNNELNSYKKGVGEVMDMLKTIKI